MCIGLYVKRQLKLRQKSQNDVTHASALLFTKTENLSFNDLNDPFNAVPDCARQFTVKRILTRLNPQQADDAAEFRL